MKKYNRNLNCNASKKDYALVAHIKNQWKLHHLLLKNKEVWQRKTLWNLEKLELNNELKWHTSWAYLIHSQQT